MYSIWERYNLIRTTTCNFLKMKIRRSVCQQSLTCLIGCWPQVPICSPNVGLSYPHSEYLHHVIDHTELEALSGCAVFSRRSIWGYTLKIPSVTGSVRGRELHSVWERWLTRSLTLLLAPIGCFSSDTRDTCECNQEPKEELVELNYFLLDYKNVFFFLCF